jgi:hypothetical protein
MSPRRMWALAAPGRQRASRGLHSTPCSRACGHTAVQRGQAVPQAAAGVQHAGGRRHHCDPGPPGHRPAWGTTAHRARRAADRPPAAAAPAAATATRASPRGDQARADSGKPSAASRRRHIPWHRQASARLPASAASQADGRAVPSACAASHKPQPSRPGQHRGQWPGQSRRRAGGCSRLGNGEVGVMRGSVNQRRAVAEPTQRVACQCASRRALAQSRIKGEKTPLSQGQQRSCGGMTRTRPAARRTWPRSV